MSVPLDGVPETMLWTLYNRASEARRRDALLVNPEAVRICDAIAYDYLGKFGPPNSAHRLRARLFDNALRPWLRAHPPDQLGARRPCRMRSPGPRCSQPA
jgi:O-methyltransferase involved in polyketide biosynthesis